MLLPAKVKYRKRQRGRIKGIATRGDKIAYGEYAIKAIDRGRLTSRQIEAARRAMTRHVKRGGKIWLRIFPDQPVTKKAAETRMGSGKGSLEYWVSVILPGRVLFEMSDVGEDIAREALRRAAHKLPIATRFVKRNAM